MLSLQIDSRCDSEFLPFTELTTPVDDPRSRLLIRVPMDRVFRIRVDDMNSALVLSHKNGTGLGRVT